MRWGTLLLVPTPLFHTTTFPSMGSLGLPMERARAEKGFEVDQVILSLFSHF